MSKTSFTLPVQTRLIEHIGTVAYLRIYWHTAHKCEEGKGYHNALNELIRSPVKQDWGLGGSVMAYPHDDPRWPKQCDHCGLAVPTDGTVAVEYQVFHKNLYNTESGNPEPGDLFYVYDDPDFGCDYGWTNCDGKHLNAILPNGRVWDIDGRASNCTLLNDKTHRCWIRHGEPPLLTVDKKGHTCSAGMGSIAVGSYHGFLRDGKFV